jgi:hopene-associated glycosyltransferase HpnB
MITFAIAALSCLIWLYLIGARGMFWRMVGASAPGSGSPSAARIAIIVPARNEADVVAHTIQSLLAQDYPGPLHIVVVDDQSSDETAAVVRDVASEHGERVTVIASAPLPAGWTGKMWALAQGVERASAFAPDYFLFTDADIAHAPQSISAVVSLAQAGNHDLVSMMVTLRCESFAERALIPAYVFFFFMLYPPAWVNRKMHKTAAAAGGDILVRRAALAGIGGVAAIRHELIDDCALAREIKRTGSIWLGVTKNARSIRPYVSFGVIGRMISRNAFYQLNHSVWLLIGTMIGLAVTYAAPPILLFFGGWATLFGASAWLLMTFSFMPMVRFYSLSPLWALALPLVAMFYAGATVHSAIQYWLGRGGEWKDRVQDAPPASDANHSVSTR